jgi:hypothetical protein
MVALPAMDGGAFVVSDGAWLGIPISDPVPGTAGIPNSASEFGIPELSGRKKNRKNRNSGSDFGILLITYIGT